MYIGNPLIQSAFLVDTFSGNNSTTVFTMSVAPANTASVLVAVSGVLQSPDTYSVVGTTLTFTQAPPTGTGNISARYLGIPASGVTTTAYRTVTTFTATASQTTFTPPSYTVGFINVYRNGVLLTPTSDYTASNGTTVVLASGAASGDTVIVESFLVSSVLNAIPNTAGSVSGSNLVQSQILTAVQMPTGSVIQTVSASTNSLTTVTTGTYTATNLSATITPQFSTSKILLSSRCSLRTYNSSTGGAYGGVAWQRNGTYIQQPGQLYEFGTNGGSVTDHRGVVSHVILDSPSTTSSVTYQAYLALYTGTQIEFNAGANFYSDVVLQEIR